VGIAHPEVYPRVHLSHPEIYPRVHLSHQGITGGYAPPGYNRRVCSSRVIHVVYIHHPGYQRGVHSSPGYNVGIPPIPGITWVFLHPGVNNGAHSPIPVLTMVHILPSLGYNVGYSPVPGL